MSHLFTPVKLGERYAKSLNRYFWLSLGLNLRHISGTGPLRELTDSTHFPGPNFLGKEAEMGDRTTPNFGRTQNRHQRSPNMF